MSTVRAINFQHPSASAANITLASDGTVSGGIPSPNRNLLYNGAMQVSQRGTSTASITTSGYYTADRWSVVNLTQGTWTNDIQNDAPTGSGFRRSLRMLCTTADASPAAGDMISIDHILEGQDLQRIAKGTSSAQPLTFSFWVKANVTGTYCVSLYDNDNARQFSASYTISASATWEKKTILVPADTTGAFDNDNAASLYVRFYLGAGSNRTSGTLASAWAAFNAANEAVGQTNLAAATNNYWQITGVQLEVGSQATAFEFKSFGQELRECQRYYYQHVTGTQKTICSGYYSGATQVEGCVFHPVTMRTDPSLSVVTGTSYYLAVSSAGGNDFVNTWAIYSQSPNSSMIYNGTQAAGTGGQGARIETANAAASIAFSAEL